MSYVPGSHAFPDFDKSRCVNCDGQITRDGIGSNWHHTATNDYPCTPETDAYGDAQ